MQRQSAWYTYFSRSLPNFVLRCVCMTLGICLVACGIALAKLSATGTSSISCVPAVLSNIFAAAGHPEITMGVMTFALNTLFLLVEIALLRRRFPPIQLLQLPLLLFFSWAIDQWLWFWLFVPLPHYFARLTMLLASAFIVGLGVFIEVKGNVLMLPGEAVVYVISHVSKAPFHRCKVIFDTTLICTAALLSLVGMGGLYDVREGSIFSALAVGNIVKLWSRLFNDLDDVVPPAPNKLLSKFALVNEFPS